MTADQSDLDPHLRRLANRKAIPRKPPSGRSELVPAALFGTLNRDNTKKGTRGRQAVDAALYATRRRAHPELPAREALGIRVRGSRQRIASFYADDPPRMVTVEGVTARDMVRAGTYMQATQILVDSSGNHDWAETARVFERRFRRWKPIAGLTLVSDPQTVVALSEALRAAEIDVIFDSGRSRPGRRRRVA